MSDKPLTADRPSMLRRLRVPLIAIGVPVSFFVLLAVCDRTDVLPEAIMPLMMLFQATLALAVIILPIWFLFFSGYRWWTKAFGVLLVAAAIGTVIGITRDLDFTANMQPIFVTRWQRDLQAEFAERLKTVSTDAAIQLKPSDLAIAADDFPRYRGVGGDGVAAPCAVSWDWDQHKPQELWRTTVGWSYAGIAVAGTVAVTLEQRDDKEDHNEAVVCYDRATGNEIWSYRYPAHFKHMRNMGGGGPRSTPTIADGDIYSLGAKGDLVCLDGTSGKKRWAVNIVKDSGAKVIEWGMTGSPLITGGLVIVNAGIDPADNKKQAVAAYDRKTGKRVWAAGDQAAGYSSPMLVKLAGVEQIVLFDAGGLAGIAIADGKELWRYPWTTFQGMNIIQPVVLPGDRLFISSQATNGCAAIQVKQTGSNWSATKVWANRNLAAQFANPVYYDGHIYGLHKGTLCCLDAATGQRRWLGERIESGQLLLTGGTLVVQTELTGEVIAVAADAAEYRELGRFKVFEGPRTWNTPALAGGRLYLRNHQEMVCLELAR